MNMNSFMLTATLAGSAALAWGSGATTKIRATTDPSRAIRRTHAAYDARCATPVAERATAPPRCAFGEGRWTHLPQAGWGALAAGAALPIDTGWNQRRHLAHGEQRRTQGKQGHCEHRHQLDLMAGAGQRLA